MAISDIGVGLRSALTSGSGVFVAINIAANLLFLARSYVAMRVLDHEQLGVMALLQTLMLLIATLQFGVINGGYRLRCSKKALTSLAASTILLTTELLTACVCVVILACALPFTASTRTAFVATLGVLGGTSTLVRNYGESFWLLRSNFRVSTPPRFGPRSPRL